MISPIHKNIESILDIEGKRLGYVGEFGKVMIDDLAKNNGISENSYQMIRVGMDAARAIIHDQVDAAIGISCLQQLEVEDAGITTRLLRIDKAAKLGCCCFCSIVYITLDSYIETYREMLQDFMRATLQGVEFTREHPEQAFQCLAKCKPSLNNNLNKKIFSHTLPFLAKDGLNVARDWEKVANYARRLGILKHEQPVDTFYTNAFVPVKSKEGESLCLVQ